MTTDSQQYCGKTTEENFRELYKRTAELNDTVRALLSPAWGSEMGLLPADHPLYQGEKPTVSAATEVTEPEDERTGPLVPPILTEAIRQYDAETERAVAVLAQAYGPMADLDHPQHPINVEKTARVFAALHRSAEDTVTRVIALYEQWVKAGPPPLGTSTARWWDARLVELHNAIQPPIREQRERPTHPDGTPYSYAEITAEGWGFCEGCRMWTTGTPERPHECAETYNHVAPADQTTEK
ncbi:hypothetical protein [Streptomyces sp. TOR3209]|uniref:hypothetical protein n=1 Tax=Streptomyces sp. TOR3209 TaxID=1073567 RepID=UPI00031D5FBB|nr:hypothetical protein [Streptomyces sp. TOR3209]